MKRKHKAAMPWEPLTQFTVLNPLRMTFVGQPRTKSNVTGWHKKGIFKPSAVVEFETSVKAQAVDTLFREGIIKAHEDLPIFIAGALYAQWTFYFKQKPSTRDVQNYFKSACDALNAVVWKDDSQIVMIVGLKFKDADRPRIELVVHELDHSALDRAAPLTASEL